MSNNYKKLNKLNISPIKKYYNFFKLYNKLKYFSNLKQKINMKTIDIYLTIYMPTPFKKSISILIFSGNSQTN